MTLGLRDCASSSDALIPVLKVFTFYIHVGLVFPVLIQCHRPLSTIHCSHAGKALESLHLMAVVDGCFAKQSITIARGCRSSKLSSVFGGTRGFSSCFSNGDLLALPQAPQQVDALTSLVL